MLGACILPAGHLAEAAAAAVHNHIHSEAATVVGVGEEIVAGGLSIHAEGRGGEAEVSVRAAASMWGAASCVIWAMVILKSEE